MKRADPVRNPKWLQRAILGFVGSAILGVVVFPWGEALLDELGAFSHPTKQLATAAQFVRTLTLTPWFAWTFGISLGVALGILLGLQLSGYFRATPRAAGKPVDEPADTPAIPKSAPENATANPRPSVALPKSDWPRVAAIAMREAKFTFSGLSDGRLESGACHIDIENSSRMRLEKCSVFIASIDDGETVKPVGQSLASRNKDGGSTIAEFDLPPGQKKRLILCRRDLKDIISRPPWVMQLTGGEWPLLDGKTHTLKIELRSNYDHPTLVSLALGIDTQKSVSANIADQTV